MRIAALNIMAFGRFADYVLDFGDPRPDLHIIYGANEAGKTTALEALRALLYGVDERTRYGFMHPNADLRIGGRLTGDGGTLELIRRKGRKNTLLDGEGELLDEGVLRRYLGAVEQEQYYRMFALTHEDLVVGGNEILEGKGNVGQALFAAGLGGVHLNALLRATQEQAEQLFKPRASTRPLNQKISRMRELDAQIRKRQLSGREWASQQEELGKASRALDELRQQAAELELERAKLQRLQRTMPLLSKREQLETKLLDLGDVVALPDDFDDSCGDALSRQAAARKSLESLRTRLRQNEEQAAAIDVPDELLGRAAEIEELQERVGSHRKAQDDLGGLRGQTRSLQEQRDRLLNRLPGKPTAEAAAAMMPDAGVQAAVHALATDRSAINERLKAASQELEDCEAAISRTRTELEKLPPERDPSELQRAARATRQQGDLEAGLGKQERECTKQEAKAHHRLAQLGLWQGEPRAALTLSVPMLSTVDDFGGRFRDLDEERKQVDARDEGRREREAALHQDLQSLAGAGAVPLEADLVGARHDRDEGWQLIKRHYVLSEPVDLTLYAPDGDAAGVYERQVEESDALADRLWRESEKVARRAQMESELGRCRRDRAELAEQLGKATNRRDALEVEWRQQWAGTGIEPLAPEQMREWLQRLGDLRQAVERLDELLSERDALREAIDQAQTAVTREIVALGEPAPPDGGSLSEMLERADAVLEDLQEQRNRHGQLTERLEGALQDRERRQQAVEEAEKALKQWQEQWTRATRGLPTDDASSVQQVVAVVSVFKELDEVQGKANAIDSRVRGIERDATEFEQDVARVVSDLAPELDGLTPEDAVRQLNERLKAGEKAQSLLIGLQKQAGDCREEIDRAEEALRSAEHDLGELSRLADCDVSGLRAAWERHQDRAALQAKLSETEEELLRLGDGKTLAELQTEAADADMDQVAARLHALKDELADCGDQQAEQAKLVGELRKTVALMDGASAAAQAAEERQGLLAAMRDETEEYLSLILVGYLGGKVMESYRERNQAPILERAGELFRLITLNSFTDLSLDYGDDEDPFIVGVRDDGRTVPVDGMSDGTCDQLYFALRLASVEQFGQQREPLPFVADDVLIRFDDDRTRAALRILAELAVQTQVIFFTHHTRLQQLADEVLGDGGYRLHALPA